MLKKILSASLAFMMMSAMLVGCEGEKKDADKDGAVPSEAPAPSEKEAVNDTEAHSGEVSYVNASGEAFPITLLSSGRDVTEGAFDARYAGVNNAFAAVMAGAAKQEGSFVCSPLSLEIALQVLSNGGDEETSRILLESICPGMTREEVNMSAAKLIAMLTESEGVNISSAVVVNKYMRLCEDFANNAADSFKASVGALDFSDPKAALEEINGWVEKNTDGMIKQLLDNIEPDTAVVILNALTFKLDWEKPFTALRELSDFKGEKGLEKVGMIQTSGEFEYGEFGEGQVVMIPYKGGEYAMAVMLPEYDADPADTLAALIGRLGECDTAKVFLKMPKIELETKLDILKMADSLGIREAVNGNYTRLVDNDGVEITQIVHGATLSVTEFGTTATAATAIVGRRGISIFVPEHEVICDRPYAMAIVHVETGTVLFVSVVYDV